MRKNTRPKRGFFAPIYEGILTPHHKAQIGCAIWEFIALNAWVTSEIPDPDSPEEKLGIVLSGKPITIQHIATQLGDSLDTTKRNLKKLETTGYITRERVEGGYKYAVKKSKKWSQPVDDQQGINAPPIGQICTPNNADLPPAQGINAPLYMEENKENKQNNINKPPPKETVTDAMVDMIRFAHPKGTQDRADGVRAIRKAIALEAKVHGGQQAAAEYLHKRTLVYAEKVKGWTEFDRKKYGKMCASWFNKESYNNPDDSYERQGDKKVHTLPDGREMPGYIPRPVRSGAAQ